MVELGTQFTLFLSCLLHRTIFSLVHRPSSSVIKNWRQGRPGKEDLQLLQNEFFQCTYVGYCFFLQMSSGADHYSWDILRGLRMRIRQFYDGILYHIDHKKKQVHCQVLCTSDSAWPGLKRSGYEATVHEHTYMYVRGLWWVYPWPSQAAPSQQ